jgi:hypothetical protein
MSLCWKLLIPVTLLNLMVTAVLLLAFPGTHVPVAIANWLMLGGVMLLIPFLQKRRLIALRQRLETRRLALATAERPR